jgi:hypothetical protein
MSIPQDVCLLLEYNYIDTKINPVGLCNNNMMGKMLMTSTTKIEQQGIDRGLEERI